jgi:hypothetical protein
VFALPRAFGKLPNAAGWQPALPRYETRAMANRTSSSARNINDRLSGNSAI